MDFGVCCVPAFRKADNPRTALIRCVGPDEIPGFFQAPEEPVRGLLAHASAFNASDIDRVLRNLEVRTLIAAGVGTDVCVESTARDAVDRGFNCIIVQDACATLDECSHDAALLAFAKWFGKVATTREVIARLRPGGASAARRREDGAPGAHRDAS